MKHILIILFSITLTFSVSGCANTAEKYPYNYIGFYDTVTRQYINLGDNKLQIEKILGNGIKGNSSLFYDSYNYDDCLSILYDKNNTVELIRVYNDLFPHDGNSSRYEFPGGTKVESVVTDFMDLYEHVYEIDGHGCNAICVFIEHTDKGDYILDKNELVEIYNKERDFGTIYEFSVEYYSYDDISCLAAERIDAPDIKQWDKIISDIN